LAVSIPRTGWGWFGPTPFRRHTTDRDCFNPSDGLGVVRTNYPIILPQKNGSFNPSDGLGVVRTLDYMIWSNI